MLQHTTQAMGCISCVSSVRQTLTPEHTPATHTAAHCHNTQLQHIPAVCSCNTLQHTATHNLGNRAHLLHQQQVQDTHFWNTSLQHAATTHNYNTPLQHTTTRNSGNWVHQLRQLCVQETHSCKALLQHDPATRSCNTLSNTTQARGCVSSSSSVRKTLTPTTHSCNTLLLHITQAMGCISCVNSVCKTLTAHPSVIACSVFLPTGFLLHTLATRDIQKKRDLKKRH